MYRKIIFIIFLVNILSGCDFFLSKEQRSIELVQKTEVEFSPSNWPAQISMQFHKGQTVTWLYYANILSDEENCKKNNWASRYEWSSIKVEENIFIVSFLDVEYKTGLNWEVDLINNIVKYINDNHQLRNKYNISQSGKRLVENNQ